MVSKELSILIPILVFLTSFCTSQVIFPGKCPQLPVIDPFDIQAYDGIWFEIEKYPTSFEVRGKCVYSVYTDNEDGSTMELRNVLVDMETNETNEIIGTAQLIDDQKRNGKLFITYPTVSADRKIPYWVLSTDYDFYSIIWSCTQLEQENQQYLWYLSRTLNPEDGERKSVRDIMKILKLNTTALITTNQFRCQSPFAII